MTLLNPEQVAVGIITCDRFERATLTIEQVLETFPDFGRMYIFGNDPNDIVTMGTFVKDLADPRIRFISTGRIPGHPGCLSRSWNLAMQWAFRDPQVMWFWGMHDDVCIRSGWEACIQTRSADAYFAPFGDMLFLINRHAFVKVGWFDENFLGIGYQDLDWEIRAARILGVDRVVLENSLGNTLRWVMINPINLSHYWRPVQAFTPRNITQRMGQQLIMSKWHVGPNVEWEKAVSVTNTPAYSDIDWYPWFNRATGYTSFMKTPAIPSIQCPIPF